MATDAMNVNLPKWPALTVVGENVTEDQAAMIILRTGGLYFSCNDRDWERQLYDVLGVPAGQHGSPDFDTIQERSVCYGVLHDIAYLDNRRIVSCYVGGPHGWCNWDGRIFTNNYNIGKWPDVLSVLDEWRIIAKAFPFLKLESELWSGEHCEENVEPLLRFTVDDGRAGVRLADPSHPLTPLGRWTAEDDAECAARICDSKLERGCTIEQFKHALKLCDTQHQ